MSALNEENLIIENLKYVYYVLHKEFPWLAFDEDVYQEGCVGLIKAARTFNSDKSQFSTHAYLAIKHAILIHIRKLTAQKRTPEHANISLNDIPVDIGNEDKAFHQLECEIVLNDLLQKCNKKERLVIERRLLGYTQKEIAKMLGTWQSYVNRIEKSAIRKMRQGLF
jgi:RNA polymerase sporulation-specific sigma factor